MFRVLSYSRWWNGIQTVFLMHLCKAMKKSTGAKSLGKLQCIYPPKHIWFGFLHRTEQNSLYRTLSDSVLTLQYIKASHNFLMLTRLFLKACMIEHSIKWPKLVSSVLISTIRFWHRNMVRRDSVLYPECPVLSHFNIRETGGIGGVCLARDKHANEGKLVTGMWEWKSKEGKTGL